MTASRSAPRATELRGGFGEALKALDERVDDEVHDPAKARLMHRFLTLAQDALNEGMEGPPADVPSGEPATSEAPAS